MALSYDSRISEESKMRSPDRVLKLELMVGKKPLDVQGRVDPRLFKNGEDSNLLHAVMDTQTSLWSLRYDKGAIPVGWKEDLPPLTKPSIMQVNTSKIVISGLLKS